MHLDQRPAGGAREDIPPLNVHKILNGEPPADTETEQQAAPEDSGLSQLTGAMSGLCIGRGSRPSVREQ
ncbi:hypothetical protein GCM10010277_20750 [Streptomyces longisporoflavus]|nr:hypothetical protein GCM10010277_20750 [Streptomyces longisporoflavus]